MTNETRSPREIEREIEEQRSDLTSNIEDLQDKFSIDTIVRQIGDQFREHGGDMGRSISEQVKANPVPLALTGIGLAWLMFGSGKGPSMPDRTRADDRYSETENDYRQSQLGQGRPYTPPAYPVTPAARPSAAVDTRPTWAREDDDDGASLGDRLSDAAAGARDSLATGAGRAKDGITSAAKSASDTASAAAGTVSGAAASAKASLADGANAARDRLTTAGRRIAEGTETLSEEGRRRVIAARQKAIEAQRSASRSISQGTDAAADFYDRQPLVAGAIAIAVGAALGGAMPRTRAEDNLMGSQSDALFTEAQRVFEEEKAKAIAVGESVKKEVKDIASETKSDLDSGAPGDKTAAQAVADKAKSAAQRVADTAETSAKEKKLGNPDI